MGRVETFLSSLREWIAADETTPKIIYASRKPAGKFGLFNTPFPDKTHIAMGTHLNFTFRTVHASALSYWPLAPKTKLRVACPILHIDMQKS